jgi:hypothetical protein
MRRIAAVLLVSLALAVSFQIGRAVPTDTAAGAGWDTVASLERPRAYARAVPLATGEILVVGGLDPDDPEVTTYVSELIEPSTGRVTRLPQPLLGRVNHTVTTGWGGRVVVIGGTEFRRGAGDSTYWSPVDRVEVFIPDSRTWLVGAPLIDERSDHGATALPDGRILVTGGNQGTRLVRTTEIYDPSRDVWTPAAPMPRGRTQFSIATLPDGHVLVAGGFREDGRLTISTLLYDPARDAWSEGPQMLDARLNHSMVALPGGDVLFVGGESYGSGTAERYDFRKNKFTDAGRLASPRLVAQAALLGDGRVLLTGGLAFPARIGAFRPLVETEIWDPRTGAWNASGDAPSARAYGSLVRTDLGLFRVSGSGDEQEPVQTVERFRW